MGADIFDVAIVGTLVLITLNGAIKGFVGGIIGIIAIVAGFWGAKAWNALFVPYLSFISSPSLRVVIACVLVFVAVMICVGIIGRILKKIVNFSFMSWLDRFFGALLGLAKGLLLWALVILVLEKLFNGAEFLAHSRAIPYFQPIIDQICQWIPPEMANKF